MGGKEREKGLLELASWREQRGSLATWPLRTAPRNVQILDCNWSVCAEIQVPFKTTLSCKEPPKLKKPQSLSVRVKRLGF